MFKKLNSISPKNCLGQFIPSIEIGLPWSQISIDSKIVYDILSKKMNEKYSELLKTESTVLLLKRYWKFKKLVNDDRLHHTINWNTFFETLNYSSWLLERKILEREITATLRMRHYLSFYQTYTQVCCSILSSNILLYLSL